MPRKEYGVVFKADQDQQRRAALHEAFRQADAWFASTARHDGLEIPENLIGYAWVDVPPCAFTRWCNTRWLGREGVFPGFYGVEAPRGGRRFMSPGNRENKLCTVESALAGAVTFARFMNNTSGLISLTIGAALGRRP